MTVAMHVEFSGWRGPSGRFQSEVPRQLGDTLREMQAAVLRITRDEAPISHSGDPRKRPGGLREGIEARLIQQGSVGSVEVVSTAYWTRWVTEGRGPVHARPGGALHFWVNGRELFRKSVGPASANDFIARAAVKSDIVVHTYVGRLVGQYRLMLLQSDQPAR